MKLSTLHIAIIVVIFLLIALNFKSIAKAIGIDTSGLPKIPDLFGGADPAPSGGNQSSGKLDCKKVLKKGDTGAEVQQLQSYMLQVNSQILPKYGNDGDFGQETLDALKSLTGYSSISLDQAVMLLNQKFKQLGSSYQLPKPC